MTKLTNIQSALLRAAAQATGGAIDTPSDSKAAIAGLIKRGLLISTPQTEGLSRLLITDKGRAAVGPPGSSIESAVEPPEPPSLSAANASSRARKGPRKADRSAAAGKPKGKIDTLVELLRQPEGATVEAMMASTGWQAHSVRGAISGAIKQGLGLAVASEKTETVRRYRIMPDEAQA